MQYLVESADWIQISAPGKSVTVRVDEQDDGAAGHCDVRVFSSIAKPENTEAVFTQAKKVYKPSGNGDSLFLSPRSEDFSFWARTAKAGDAVTLISDEDGVGFLRQLDVSVQDSTNPFAPAYFVNQLGTAVSLTQTPINTRVINLSAGHGFINGADGQILVIEGYYMGLAVGVSGDFVTVDTPFGYTFPANTQVIRGDILMNRDGSVTPITYAYRPSANRKFDVKTINVSILDDAEMGDGKFGGGNAILNGLVIRVKKSDAWYNFIANIKTNGDVRLFGEIEYTPKPPANKYGCVFKFPLKSLYGAICRDMSRDRRSGPRDSDHRARRSQRTRQNCCCSPQPCRGGLNGD